MKGLLQIIIHNAVSCHAIYITHISSEVEAHSPRIFFKRLRVQENLRHDFELTVVTHKPPDGKDPIMTIIQISGGCTSYARFERILPGVSDRGSLIGMWHDPALMLLMTGKTPAISRLQVRAVTTTRGLVVSMYWFLPYHILGDASIAWITGC